MHSIVLAATLLAPADRPGTAPAAPSLDGTWTVLCLEKNGVPVPKAADLTVTVRGNIATFTGGDGAQKPMQFEFGPRNTVRVVEVDPGKPGTDAPPEKGPVKDLPPAQQPVKGVVVPQAGVYVVAKDYFCVTLHDGLRPGAAPEKGAPGEAKEERKDAPALTKPEFKASCVLVLKRKELAVPPKP